MTIAQYRLMVERIRKYFAASKNQLDGFLLNFFLNRYV